MIIAATILLSILMVCATVIQLKQMELAAREKQGASMPSQLKELKDQLQELQVYSAYKEERQKQAATFG